jgi:two-component system, LuxR family, sensor kinase FixL
MNPRIGDPHGHAHRRARWIDRCLWAAALGGCGAAFAFGIPSWQGTIALLIATGSVILATLRPRQRAMPANADERPQTQFAVASDAARWQAIVDTATEGIVTIDAAGLIESVNGAALRLFGYRLEELVGRNVSMLMPQPYQKEHDGYMQRYLTTGEKRIIGIGREVIGLRRDGTEFPIDLSVGQGHVDERRFFTAVIRDITKRKQMELKLTMTERLAAVGELAAGVAHEVNNPINTVINCAQLILDGDDAAENCKVIHEEAQRIADIVRDLLQFARDDRDSATPTSWPEVVARTLRLVAENWQRHGITLHVQAAESLPMVQARPQQLQQVLLNLLINAKDALLQIEGRPRTVWIAATDRADGVELTVRDNGPGVPKELGPRVFEPFVTTKRGRGGTGLGLSISKSIVESYGGTISLHDAPGQGAEFRIWLPRAIAE